MAMTDDVPNTNDALCGRLDSLIERLENDPSKVEDWSLARHYVDYLGSGLAPDKNTSLQAAEDLLQKYDL